MYFYPFPLTSAELEVIFIDLPLATNAEDDYTISEVVVRNSYIGVAVVGIIMLAFAGFFTLYVVRKDVSLIAPYKESVDVMRNR
jgi:hypothetical protein